MFDSIYLKWKCHDKCTDPPQPYGIESTLYARLFWYSRILCASRERLNLERNYCIVSAARHDIPKAV